jgi:hypothetical protein
MGDSAGAPVLAESGEEPFLDAAWTEAIEATELLRTVLSDLGIADGFPRLRGDVNVYGRPMVTVGRIDPDAARRLAAVLSLAMPGRRPQRGSAMVFGSQAGDDTPAGVSHVVGGGIGTESVPTQMPAPTADPAPMPAPRTYGGLGSTNASDDLQASALRLMRLYGGPTAPAQAADPRDADAPESWAPLLAACAVPGPTFSGESTSTDRAGLELARMPLRAEVAELDVRRGGSHRLPA